MKETIQDYFNASYQTFYNKYLSDIQKAGGHEFKAKCPFHQEQNASFCINGETGQYFCQGCGKKGDIFHFYAKINSLDTRRDFGKILKGISDDFGIPWKDRPKAKMVRAYDYTDVDGNLLYQVCRMEPKDFRQRRPDGNGKWIWNLKGAERVLYRLPQIQGANEVLVVEGEKDADTLAGLGFVATTCPMGAKKWRPEYSDHLAGKNIILCPDNDNEGREHMGQVGASLNGNVKSLKLLELPGLPSKGDVSDWVSTFQNPDEASERLAMMIENAPPYEPPKKASLDDMILTAEEFHALEAPAKMTFMNPWLTEQSIVEIIGWRGTGKTWFALSMLDAVTKGQPFGPWEVEQAVPCLFLDGEMPVQDVQERLNDLDKGSNRKTPLYIYSDAYANQFGLPRAHLAHDNWRQAMRRILTTRGVKLWVIDNISSLASGLDENKKQDWDPINQWFLELRFAGITTVFLHHEGKEGKQRGTSAREDNINIAVRLKRPHDYTPEDGARFIVHFDKGRIRTRDLPLIADTEFKLIQDATGQSMWTCSNIRAETTKEILRLLDEGLIQSAAAESLQVSQGTVSKARIRGINKGWLNKKNKLTQEGFLYVND
jgi:hypothetical protein